MANAYDYSLTHIKMLRSVIVLKKMSTPANFKRYNSKRLQKMYNGIGPDRWSSRFRKLITWALSFLEAPALIHDFEFSVGERNYKRFTIANLRLFYNAFLDRCFRAGLVACILCQLFGYKGFCVGKKKNK